MNGDSASIEKAAGTAMAAGVATPSELALGVFRAHFDRDPADNNRHDDAVLAQIAKFRDQHGRYPDTTKRADLQALQKIELDMVVPEVGTPAELLARRAAGNELLNVVEIEMMKMPAADSPLVHRWVDGLYIREIHHPKGVLNSTKIHLTEHPFTISQGAALISAGDGTWKMVEAPYTGITKPGTRRLVYAITDMVLTTYHPNPTNERDLATLESRLIFEHKSHIAGMVQPAAVEQPELEGATT